MTDLENGSKGFIASKGGYMAQRGINVLAPDVTIDWFELKPTTCPACHRVLTGGFGFILPTVEPLCFMKCAAYRRDMSALGLRRPTTVAEKLAQAEAELKHSHGRRFRRSRMGQ